MFANVMTLKMFLACQTLALLTDFLTQAQAELQDTAVAVLDRLLHEEHAGLAVSKVRSSCLVALAHALDGHLPAPRRARRYALARASHHIPPGCGAPALYLLQSRPECTHALQH